MNPIFTVADVLTPVQRALRLTAQGDITLAIQRIDTWHRELCAVADWPALRATAAVTTAGASCTLADAAGVAAVAAGATPYWYVERWDVQASDLAERRLWSLGMPSRDTDAKLVFDVWDWDADTTSHKQSTGVVLSVFYWKRPATLSQTTDKLALPATRALTVRAILDLVGLMDRKDVDVAPWRAEIDAAMQELQAFNPRAATQLLRLVSGRNLTRGPSR